MKEPLIPETQYDEFGELGNCNDDEIKIERIRQIVKGMPLLNQRTLKFLFEFFQEVADYEPNGLDQHDPEL